MPNPTAAEKAHEAIREIERVVLEGLDASDYFPLAHAALDEALREARRFGVINGARDAVDAVQAVLHEIRKEVKDAD